MLSSVFLEWVIFNKLQIKPLSWRWRKLSGLLLFSFMYSFRFSKWADWPKLRKSYKFDPSFVKFILFDIALYDSCSVDLLDLSNNFIEAIFFSTASRNPELRNEKLLLSSKKLRDVCLFSIPSSLMSAHSNFVREFGFTFSFSFWLFENNYLQIRNI